MAGSGDLAGFAAFLTSAVVGMEHAQHAALEKAAKVIEAEAKSYPGHYQPGWPALQSATVARKTKGDSPLLETGRLKESYHHRVVNSREAYVGSDDPRAVMFERGTSKMPPRPVLITAAKRKGKEASAMLGAAVVGVLTGTKPR